MYCPKCDAPNADSATQCAGCGAVLTPRVQTVEYHPGENVHLPDFPSKWYNFLIYFLLFFTAAVYGVAAILALFLPSRYGDFSAGAWFYSILRCILLLAEVAYLVVLRFQLRQYKRLGPRLLYIFNLWEALFPTLELCLAAALFPACNQDLSVTNLLSGVVGNLLLLRWNWHYFSRRKDYFTS
jgi:hypothetical protein